MIRRKLWNLTFSFIIYSIIGFFLETFYALFTEGIIESRKSFIYGPFCIVYGIAAIILTIFLNKYKNNNIKLFIYGMILGGIIEYYSSFFGELLLHVKWWDYSNSLFNINGRTCLFYIIMWGFLTILLINYIDPFVNKIILICENKNRLKLCIVLISLFMLFDGILSAYALDSFLIRISNTYNIDIKGINKSKVADMYFEINYPDEKMILTYPNMMAVDNNGENIYLDKILVGVKNYYFKINDN